MLLQHKRKMRPDLRRKIFHLQFDSRRFLFFWFFRNWIAPSGACDSMRENNMKMKYRGWVAWAGNSTGGRQTCVMLSSDIDHQHRRSSFSCFFRSQVRSPANNAWKKIHVNYTINIMWIWCWAPKRPWVILIAASATPGISTAIIPPYRWVICVLACQFRANSTRQKVRRH